MNSEFNKIDYVSSNNILFLNQYFSIYIYCHLMNPGGRTGYENG